ncbi:MAG: rhodanese-like domain-containing protein [Nonlabens sp.]
MKFNLGAVILMAMLSNFINAQEKYSIPGLLEKFNDNTVPYITVDSLHQNLSDFVVLDTRKKAEFEVSHLPNAIWAGEKFDRDQLPELDKSKPVVVYCSVGVRSENYGEDLLEDGFQRVYNLYGSIFSWKDAGYEVVDKKGNPTEEVHTYSRRWSKYLKTGKKVY